MSNNSISESKRKTFKTKVAEKHFQDQLMDLWHLLEKKNRLNREELFMKAEEENES